MNNKISIGQRALTYPNPVLVVGTYDENRNPNIMTASWTGICCSEPPCIYVSVRKQRQTYSNILINKSFTINVPTEEFVVESDFVGIYSGKEYDKFKDANLTPVKSEFVEAPYVAEFPIVLECKLINSLELGTHTQFIGEIVDIKVDETILNGKKAPSIEDVKPFIYDSGSRAYYSIGEFLGDAYQIGIKK